MPTKRPSSGFSTTPPEPTCGFSAFPKRRRLATASTSPIPTRRWIPGAWPICTSAGVGQGAQLVLHPQNNTTRPNDWKIPIHHAMLVTRAAENTIWFASCNICHDRHQNCRSMIVAPDGCIHAQTELKREELLTA